MQNVLAEPLPLKVVRIAHPAQGAVVRPALGDGRQAGYRVCQVVVRAGGVIDAVAAAARRAY